MYGCSRLSFLGYRDCPSTKLSLFYETSTTSHNNYCMATKVAAADVCCDGSANGGVADTDVGASFDDDDDDDDDNGLPYVCILIELSFFLYVHARN